MSTENLKSELQKILNNASVIWKADTTTSSVDASRDSDFQDTMKDVTVIKYFQKSIGELIEQI